MRLGFGTPPGAGSLVARQSIGLPWQRWLGTTKGTHDKNGIVNNLQEIHSHQLMLRATVLIRALKKAFSRLEVHCCVPRTDSKHARAPSVRPGLAVDQNG